MDRWFQQQLEREGSEEFVGAAHACRYTGHACGAVSDGVGLVFDFVYSVACNSLADDVECVGLRGSWCAMTVVDGDGSSFGGDVDDHLAMTSDGRASWFDYVETEAGGNGGVDRVAATLEDVDADLSGDGVSSSDCAVLNDDFVFVRSPDAIGVHEFKPPTNVVSLIADASIDV